MEAKANPLATDRGSAPSPLTVSHTAAYLHHSFIRRLVGKVASGRQYAFTSFKTASRGFINGAYCIWAPASNWITCRPNSIVRFLENVEIRSNIGASKFIRTNWIGDQCAQSYLSSGQRG